MNNNKQSSLARGMYGQAVPMEKDECLLYSNNIANVLRLFERKLWIILHGKRQYLWHAILTYT